MGAYPLRILLVFFMDVPDKDVASEIEQLNIHCTVAFLVAGDNFLKLFSHLPMLDAMRGKPGKTD